MNRKQEADYKLKVSKDWIKTKKLFVKQIFKELEDESCWFCHPYCHYMKKHYEKIKEKFLQERTL